MTELTPEQRAAAVTAVTYWHEQVWDATCGLIEANQVHTGQTVINVVRWADLDETRQQAFIAAAANMTDHLVMLIGAMLTLPPDVATVFGVFGPQG